MILWTAVIAFFTYIAASVLNAVLDRVIGWILDVLLTPPSEPPPSSEEKDFPVKVSMAWEGVLASQWRS